MSDDAMWPARHGDAEPDPSPGSTRALRQSNERRVSTVLRERGPMSQAAVARLSGLSPATINSIVRTLESKGLVTVGSGRNGREKEVSLARPTGTVLSLEIAQTVVHASLIVAGIERRFDAKWSVESDQSAAESLSLVRRMRSALLASATLSTDEVQATYVAVRAPIDPKSGRVIPSRQVPGWEGPMMREWTEMDVQAELSAALETSVIVDGDSRLAAMAEWMWGEARGSSGLLYMKSSWGIGGGVVLGGALYRGHNGLAGEIGHIVVDPSGPVCICGSRGCLFTFISGGALLRELETAGHPQPSVVSIAEGARRGDPACRRVVAEAGRRLGQAAADASRVLAPDSIVVGGELASAGQILLDPMTAALEESGLWGSTSHPRVSLGMLRSDMSALGAAASHWSSQGAGSSDMPAWLRAPVAVRMY